MPSLRDSVFNSKLSQHFRAGLMYVARFAGSTEHAFGGARFQPCRYQPTRNTALAAEGIFSAPPGAWHLATGAYTDTVRIPSGRIYTSQKNPVGRILPAKGGAN